MKLKTLTALLFAIFAWNALMAIPADPKPKTLRQPDGTYISVVMCGNEHAHAFFTPDGTPLLRNALSGMLEPTTVEKAWVRGMAHRDFSKPMCGARRVDGQYQHPLISNFPTLGHQKTLVVLIEFNDVKFSSVDAPNDFYTRMLNEEGFSNDYGANGSARDFYHVSSANLFDPEFIVVGPIELTGKATFYGTDAGTQDANMGLAVKEACEKANSDFGVDFSEYDADGDGVVDNVAFIYAGNGQADTPNGSELIWPHAAELDEAWKINLTLNGKIIRHYFCSNELRYRADGQKVPTGIGTVCHEFGHILGLPDLYNVTYNPIDVGVSYWDTMAGGSYNNDMNTPPTFSSYERMVLRWLTPDTLAFPELKNLDHLLQLSHLMESNKAYYVPVSGKPNEYFMLENRQQKGWDEYLYGHGLLMWHIDEVDSLWQKNTVNVDWAHHHVDIECADGTRSEGSREGDPMPGTNDVTHFQLNSWEDSPLLTIDGLTEDSEGLIRFLIADTDYRLPSPAAISLVEVQDSSFVFTWETVDEAVRYLVEVSDTEGQTVMEKETAQVETITAENLRPYTCYKISVRSVRGEYISERATLEVQTEKLIFAERFPEVVWTTDIVPGGFTAHWQEVEDADDYHVTLYQHSFSTQPTEQGYGFDDKADGMPSLWTSSSTTYYSLKDYYGNAAPSLRLSKDGDYLEVSFPEQRIDQLRFWMRGKGAEGKVIIEMADEEQWSTFAEITPSSEADTYCVDIPHDDVLSTASFAAPRIRIRFERAEGFVVIDDVMLSCTAIDRTEVDGRVGVPTGGEKWYAFSGLQQGVYSFRVCGLADAQPSLSSPECQVLIAEGVPTCIAHPSPLISHPSPLLRYDLQGRSIVVNSLKGKTIIVANGKKTIVR